MDIRGTFAKMEEELESVGVRMSDPAVIADQNTFRELGRRHSELQEAVDMWHEYQEAETNAEEAGLLLADAEDEEMREYLQAEQAEAQATVARLHNALLLHLLPKDPMHDKNAIVEIRAGTGGDEAGLFAGDLFGMYAGLAELRGWSIEVLDENQSEMGGYKEVSFIVEGKGAFGTMKHESGVHRVQRVPKTESQGRIHTSAASVIILAEAEDVDIDIQPSDLKIENFRAGGPGGQHMQKNDTAVRMTHLPSGMTVVSSNQRSQHQNREQALRMLRSRLLEAEAERKQKEEADARRSQVGTGDRSEKIRTYNWPQDRVTDHRIGVTIHNIPAIMNGEIGELLNALREHEDAERLKQVVEQA